MNNAGHRSVIKEFMHRIAGENVKLNYDYIALTLNFAGFLFLALSILKTNVSIITPFDKFGLLALMPLYFWIAFFLILSSIYFVCKCDNKQIYIYSLLVINILLYSFPLMEDGVRVGDALWHMGMSDYITITGTVDTTKFTYFQWPGTFIFASFLLFFTKIPSLTIVRFFPTFSSLLLTFSFFTFVKKVSGSLKSAYLAAVLMVFGLFRVHMFFSPQSMAYLFFPLILLSFLSKTRFGALLGLLLSVSLVIIHPLTSIWLILILLGMQIFSLLLFRKVNGLVPQRRIMLFSLLFIFWLIYVGTKSFTDLTNFFYNLITTLASIQRAEALIGKPSVFFSYITNYIRFTTYFFIFMSVVALISLFREKKKDFFSFFASWTGVFSLGEKLTPFLVPQGNFAWRLFNLFIFGASATSMSKTRLVKKMTARYIPLIIIALSIASLCRFYDESNMLVNSSELTGTKFVATEIPLHQKSLSVGTIYFFDPLSTYTRIYASNVYDSLVVGQVDFVLLQTSFIYADWENYKIFMKNSISQFETIYSSRSFSLLSKHAHNLTKKLMLNPR